jgi:O-antigen/teichoic acid export membrane protein
MGETSRRLRDLAGRSGVYLIGNVVAQLATLITFPLYARVLGPSSYGLLTLLTAFVGLGRTVLLGGVNTALVRHYVGADDDRRRIVVGSALGYAVLAALGVNALSLAAARPLADLLFAPGGFDGVLIIRLAVLSLALDVFVELLLGLARARNSAFVFVTGISARVVATIAFAVIFLVVMPMGVSGAMLAMVGANLAACLALGILMRDSLSLRFDPATARTLLLFGVALVPMNLGSWVLNLADRYMLQWFGSLEMVGWYSAAYRVGTLVTVVFVAPFHNAWLPYMFEHAEQSHGPGIIGTTSRLFVAVGLVAVTALAAFGGELLRLLAGSAYLPGAAVIPLVALGAFLGGTASVFAPGIMVANKTWMSSAIFVLGAAVNVALNLALIPAFGMAGAAWATLISYTLIALGHLAASQRLYPIDVRPPSLIASLVLCVGIVILIPQVAESTSGWQSLAIRVGIALGFTLLLPVTGLVTFREIRSGIADLLAHSRAWLSGSSGGER